MGIIKPEVRTAHGLTQKDLEIAKIFTTNFNVNYGTVVNACNTTITTFILEPEEFIAEGFGIEKEVILVVSHFDGVEARAIQAAEALFKMNPYKNRVDGLCYFFVSGDDNVEEWIRRRYSSSINSYIVFPFSVNELIRNKNDPWYIRNKLKKYSFDKDLFGFLLPLRDDSSFFGRQQILGRYIDCIRRGQNRGIFGLRKTGKTSLLLKIIRTVKEQQLGFVVHYDCKNPQVYLKRWYELLNDVTGKVSERLGMPKPDEGDEVGSISAFEDRLTRAGERGEKIILIFDEIEYISNFAPGDSHWRTDYFRFWQTLWSEQSQFPNLCFLICGVNAQIIERDSIGETQNPLFGIVQSEYLKGLSRDETANMIHTLGRRMGLKFDYEATNFLFEQYGGHPMLTRVACSWINEYLADAQRPVTIGRKTVENLQANFDSDPAFIAYFAHIVSEIRKFYPTEYEMLEMLSSGQHSDFIELSADREFVNHLYAYGLVADCDGVPAITLPVAGRYIALEFAKREGRKTLYKLAEPEDRPAWLRSRLDLIIDTMHELEKGARIYHKPELFGVNSFADADKLKALGPVTDEAGFSYFVNVLHKCFTESIVNYGKSRNDAQYFQNTVKNAYKTLWKTLDKIKEYRNAQDHLLLTETHGQKLKAYLEEDLEPLASNADKLYCLQQKLADELLTSIHSELSNLD